MSLKLLTRLSARVFCPAAGTNGGNPVTVFHTNTPVSARTRKAWAQTCDWESVVVVNNNNNNSNSNIQSNSVKSNNQMYFYMPTGENVSFCAHAAMGGALLLQQQKGNNNNSNVNQLLQPFVAVTDDESVNKEYAITIHRDEAPKADQSIISSRIVSLHMNNVDFYEEPVQHQPALLRLLRLQLKVDTSRQSLPTNTNHTPTMINSSVARPKTLVAVRDIHACVAPTQAKVFKRACQALDSTGVYVYAPHESEDFAWETRQFPMASGYAEDPATGIAAAALAVSLHRRGVTPSLYKFYQGTAMNRPSVIAVENVQIHTSNDNDNDDDNDEGNKQPQSSSSNIDDDDDFYNPVPSEFESSYSSKVSFQLLGRVQVHEREERELTSDELLL